MKMNKKGFTLAELLVVVAIIAVLVAIAIPIFTAQLEKAREATDAANLRSAYAEVSLAVLDNEIGVYAKVEMTQTDAGFKELAADANIGGELLSRLTTVKTGVPAYVCVDTDGACTLTATKPTTGYTDIAGL